VPVKGVATIAFRSPNFHVIPDAQLAGICRKRSVLIAETPAPDPGSPDQVRGRQVRDDGWGDWESTPNLSAFGLDPEAHEAARRVWVPGSSPRTEGERLILFPRVRGGPEPESPRLMISGSPPEFTLNSIGGRERGRE